MWKRDNEPGSPTSASTPGPTPSPARADNEPAAPAPRTSAAPASAGERTVLSPSVVIHGEVSGEEDLIVEGRVEGKISLRQNQVTVGAKGRVAAEIHARVIHIDGEVEGNLTAEEQIVLRRTSRVRGDMLSPRVTIEDGARFKGSIDMEPRQRAAATVSARPAGVREETGTASPRPLDVKSSAQAS
jgi:cytoskeletal protein CcmA (bactofilin family)